MPDLPARDLPTAFFFNIFGSFFRHRNQKTPIRAYFAKTNPFYDIVEGASAPFSLPDPDR